MARKSDHDEDELEDLEDDFEDDDEDGDDEDDTIDLDSAEEEEEDDDDDEDDEEDDSVESIEARRLFQSEAEEILEHLTLDDVTEVLRENDLEVGDAPKLRRFLQEVVAEGEVTTMEEAWEEALTRLEES
ncbi:MAG TPA: hypothetical protein VFR02_08555 [bacterium]|nr:hypothetical protein [bacterium]